MTVGVVGLGLIGGSIGLALRDPDRLIVGYDPNEANANLALDRACVDRLGSLAEVAVADVVFVAAPPAKVVDVLDQLKFLRGPDTVITDCTSVKRIVADWAESTRDPLFVPGHPMAGHEKSGPGFASAWMFRSARWILSPLPFTQKSAINKVESLVKAMGATPLQVPADRHDRHVAVVSHLPHALAALLVQLADGLDDKNVAGGSWRDLTRVGGVDPALWSQIFIGNRVELGRVIGEMSKRLAVLESDVVAGNEKAVLDFFIAAQEAKGRQTTSAGTTSETTKTKNLKGRKRV